MFEIHTSLKRHINCIKLWMRNLKLRISNYTSTEKSLARSISWQNKSTAMQAVTHSCTTNPNDQSLFWLVGAADSEIDSEQHLRWLRPTFPLRFLADDKRGRQVGPSDPPRAHILLNTDPDYPWEHTHSIAHTYIHTGLWGNESESKITLSCLRVQGRWALPPQWLVRGKKCLCVLLCRWSFMSSLSCDFEIMLFLSPGK